MSSEDEGSTRPNLGTLPTWASLLVVVAHPDDESFGLGAVLEAFTRAGTQVELLCFSQGEASTLHGVAGDLASVRAAELNAAANALGVRRTTLLQYSDGSLSEVSRVTLAADVAAAVDSSGAQGMLVFDATGVTGHPDHVAATAAALAAAETLNLPVLAWTLPESVAAQLNQEFGAGFAGQPADEIDLRVSVSRERQKVAIQAHASQAVPGSVLWRRLELLGDAENLRWLRHASPRTLRVAYRKGDRFDIRVRGHVISVDQPIEDGGDDTAATPTELFIASLASCVAFYARRYLARHDLPTDGLAVEATFEMGAKPARVSVISVRLILPGGVPAERHGRLLAVASHCTVHNSLTTPPTVTIALAGPAEES